VNPRRLQRPERRPGVGSLQAWATWPPPKFSAQQSKHHSCSDKGRKLGDQRREYPSPPIPFGVRIKQTAWRAVTTHQLVDLTARGRFNCPQRNGNRPRDSQSDGGPELDGEGRPQSTICSLRVSGLQRALPRCESRRY